MRRAAEPGLSVIIPYPDEDIEIESVIRSVINQYFFPILSGDLAVTVAGGAHQQALDGATLLAYIAGTAWPDRRALIRRLEFARWCLEQREAALERLREPPVGRAPKWDEALFEPGQLQRLRSRFERGERLALHLPLWVEPRKGASSTPISGCSWSGTRGSTGARISSSATGSPSPGCRRSARRGCA